MTVPLLFETIQQELQEIQAQGLYRSWRRVEAVEGSRIRVDGRWLLHLASNNYLGLSQHPRVVAAAKEAIDRYGAGAGSARLIGGTFALHEELEEQLARFKQTEQALVFPTGYMANLGILSSLAGPEDLILGDRLNHASLIDACRLSKATFRVYPHGDPERLEAALKHRTGRYRRTLIATETVFSMDGTLAPLPEIVEVARRHGAWLLIDDAHATGVFGARGRGTLEHFGISPDDILQMGTLSKALGSLGGYLAGPRPVIEMLKNRARSFLYTTALPPASCAAALEALRVIEEEPLWRKRLWENVESWVSHLSELGCDLLSRSSPIVPVRIGSNEKTMALAQALFEEGIYAPGIRPPTVPAGSARIRTSITALHAEPDLKRAIISFRNALENEKISRFPLKAYGIH